LPELTNFYQICGRYYSS